MTYREAWSRWLPSQRPWGCYWDLGSWRNRPGNQRHTWIWMAHIHWWPEIKSQYICQRASYKHFLCNDETKVYHSFNKGLPCIVSLIFVGIIMDFWLRESQSFSNIINVWSMIQLIQYVIKYCTSMNIYFILNLNVIYIRRKRP